jgi:chromosome partitioning protein
MSGLMVSIVNNKGGVGKTTVAINLSHALTRRDKRILVIDLDSQCNATSILLPRTNIRNTLYELFEDPTVETSQCVYSTAYEKLSCIPNIDNTSALEPMLLDTLPENYKILRNRVREYALNNYDVTILDCPPNMGFFVISALHASDFVIVPNWIGSTFSIEGLLKAIDLIHKIQQDENGNPDLRFLRLLINQVDKRTVMSKVALELINNHFTEDQVFKTMIPSNAAFQRAEHDNKTIIRYAPSAPGSKAFRSLAKEFIDILSTT